MLWVLNKMVLLSIQYKRKQLKFYACLDQCMAEGPMYVQNAVKDSNKWSLKCVYILCTISLAISYVSHLFCAHLCAMPINCNCNEENRILGK